MVAKLRKLVNEWTTLGILLVGAFWTGFFYFRVENHEIRITDIEGDAKQILAVVNEIKSDVKVLKEVRSELHEEPDTEYGSSRFESSPPTRVRGRSDSPWLRNEADIRSKKHVRTTIPLEEGS